MKKYTPIFGPQELFDGVAEDVIAIRVNDYKKITYYHHNEEDLKSKSMQDLHAIPIVAMRRIEEAPEPKRWTVADQEAGRLPEVGVNVEFVFNDEFNYYEPIEELKDGDILNVLAHVKGENGCTCVAVYNERTNYTTQLVIESIRPIETPDEKAARVRSEWVKTALHLYMSSSKNDTNSMGDVYDAMLSGELPPVQAKEIQL